MGYLYPGQEFRQKACKHCLTVFTPVAPAQLFCSPPCAATGKRNQYLQRNYSISAGEYSARLYQQNNRCKICDREGFLMKEHHQSKLVVDHCHTTGEVRGLLCHNCNRALGLLKDDTEALERAINYLRGI